MDARELLETAAEFYDAREAHRFNGAFGSTPPDLDEIAERFAVGLHEYVQERIARHAQG